jgi:hypothetical protein
MDVAADRRQLVLIVAQFGNDRHRRLPGQQKSGSDYGRSPREGNRRQINRPPRRRGLAPTGKTG